MIDPYTLSVLLFFGILAIVIYRDRKNIDFKYILIMIFIMHFKIALHQRLTGYGVRLMGLIRTICVYLRGECMFA